jgi:stage V sporulation protein SpoVS
MMQRLGQIMMVAALAALPAHALPPPLPCEGTEAGMMTFELTVLDPEHAKSGVVIENYLAGSAPGPDGVYVDLPGPVGALDGFNGVRITHCASGIFHAVTTDQRPGTVAAALAATEFLRAKVKAGQSVGRNELAQAVRAVYGKQTRLRETEETCGCSVSFPELRPKGMKPYGERTDTTTTNY